MRGLLAVIGLTIGGVLFASDSVGDVQYEIRLNMSVNQPTETQQAWLRKKSGWDNWNQTTSGWMTIMSKRTGLPHRAWGAGIDFDGGDVETKHLNFVETVLPYFSISQHQISVDFNKNRSLKHDRIFQKQQVNGYDVLLSQLQTKWKEGKLVLWALDWWQVQISSDGGDTWQYLENTSQQDIDWRRKAFNISEHIELTSEFMMQFIASDSTTVGEYLDGGSLVEGALDDIILYDVLPQNHSTSDIEHSVDFMLMPNPTSDVVRLQNLFGLTPIRIYNSAGALVYEVTSSEGGNATIDVSGFANGIYTVESRNSMARRSAVRLEIIN